MHLIYWLKYVYWLGGIYYWAKIHYIYKVEGRTYSYATPYVLVLLHSLFFEILNIPILWSRTSYSTNVFLFQSGKWHWCTWDVKFYAYTVWNKNNKDVKKLSFLISTKSFKGLNLSRYTMERNIPYEYIECLKKFPLYISIM